MLKEGIPDEIIHVTGNPVIDALQFVADQPEPEEIKGLLTGLEIWKRDLVLVTAHRRENFGEPIENISHALKKLAGRGDVEIIYPVHLNPNVQEPVYRILGDVPHVTLLPPQDYLSLVHLMKQAKIILTDSGGIQEEAPAFGVPVLVMRDVTERPEGITAGTLKLVGTEAGAIFREAMRLLDDASAHEQMAKAVNPFGDGRSAKRIVAALRSHQDHL